MISADGPTRPQQVVAMLAGKPRLGPNVARLMLCAVVLTATGCAFDISQVQRLPTTFEPVVSERPAWVLQEDRSISLGTGFPTRLKARTHWSLVGRVPSGEVYRTTDQVVVEASNMFEAQAVIRDNALVGFYLPVERSLVAVSPPIILPIVRE
jgi:hypothetical protein